ncbi:MAG: hypothetical protein KBC48_01105 [Candidatus Pacebacteria bacterium]|nr:hypothetical protein [Candidatus Paceibacterota bacterium]
MKNIKIVLIVIIGVIVLFLAYSYLSRNKVTELSLENELITESSISKSDTFSFDLPVGWYSKPYPYASTTIFISPEEIIFPPAWEGPLTPVAIMKGSKAQMQESITASRANEPQLEMTESIINGYTTLRIKGIPQNSAYVGGRYLEDVYLEKGTEVVKISYIDRDTVPDYLAEFEFIINSIRF